MADTHGHDSHDSHHDHAPEADVLRTPLWLTGVGLGLLLLGSLGTYLFVYPGTMASHDDESAESATADGGAAGDASAAPSPGNGQAPAGQGQPSGEE